MALHSLVWATVRLENDGGAWEGRLKTTGVLTAPAHTTLIIDYLIYLDVKVTPLPAADGAIFNTYTNPGYGEETFSRSAGRMYHYLYFKIYGGQSALNARVTVWNDSYIAPATAKRMVSGFPEGTEAPQWPQAVQVTPGLGSPARRVVPVPCRWDLRGATVAAA